MQIRNYHVTWKWRYTVLNITVKSTEKWKNEIIIFQFGRQVTILGVGLIFSHKKLKFVRKMGGIFQKDRKIWRLADHSILGWNVKPLSIFNDSQLIRRVLPPFVILMMLFKHNYFSQTTLCGWRGQFETFEASRQK